VAGDGDITYRVPPWQLSEQALQSDQGEYVHAASHTYGDVHDCDSMRTVVAHAGDSRRWATGMVYRTRVRVPGPQRASQGDQSDQSLTGHVPVVMGTGFFSQSLWEYTYAGCLA
jgi:hypothetical protein